jgi:XTP/dITP diphosphohydrolase
MQLLLGTNNKGKVIEMQEALSSLDLTIVKPIDLGITDIPEETGDTFMENAEQKARFYFEKGNLPTLADDSGIIVDALAGELGIHTRRWGAGRDATDEEWIRVFLDRMSHEKNKHARFLCTLVFIDQEGISHEFEGRCDGIITNTLEADFLPGLPISACFKPLGYDEVYSAMSVEDKNDVSHRGKALQLFEEFLRSKSGK